MTENKRDESVGLYVSWQELHRRTSPAMGEVVEIRRRTQALIRGCIARLQEASAS